MKAIGRRTGDFLGHGLADECNPEDRIGIVKNSMTLLRVVGPACVISARAAEESGSSKAGSESDILPSETMRHGRFLPVINTGYAEQGLGDARADKGTWDNCRGIGLYCQRSRNRVASVR